MMQLLSLYQWAIFAGLTTAPALTLLGSQLATRDRAMQTLCIGQGAMVGVLLGIGTLHEWEASWIGTFGPFVSGLVVSGITFLATDRLVATKVASKNTTFAFIFALLLAAGYLISSLFPALESHMAQVYFGDLATLSVLDSKIAFIASLLSMGFLLSRTKSISNQSFELAVFGSLMKSRVHKWELAVFKTVSLVMLCFSVQFVGFLFTIATLFLPTAMMNFLETKGLKLHLWTCTIIAMSGTLIGFVFSLHYTRLPTVPAIVAAMFVLGVVVLGFERIAIFARRLALPKVRVAEQASAMD